MIRLGNVSMIDANVIKKVMTEHPREISAEEEAANFDTLKVYQLIFSKKLPKEITNSMMNLFHAISYPNVANTDVENAVVKFN